MPYFDMLYSTLLNSTDRPALLFTVQQGGALNCWFNVPSLSGAAYPDTPSAPTFWFIQSYRIKGNLAKIELNFNLQIAA